VNSQTSRDSRERLERIWASDSEHVRRMLIGLARDIDLADDLLQETYLKALNGMPGYRGDNDRAWLSAIARNLFFYHMRRHYVHAETSDDDDARTASCPSVGTPHHLDLIQIRQAIAVLGPDLRTALLMKHYCGFTYDEIADQSGCAVGTAKWRVSMAIGKLKEAIGVSEEAMEMTCADLNATRMLDYLYECLSPDEAEAMDRHLRKCPKCRGRLDGTRRILSALDALEEEINLMQIVELEPDGRSLLYTSYGWVNTSDQPINEIRFCSSKCNTLEYLGVRGEELVFTQEENDDDPRYENTYTYSAVISPPVVPGEKLDRVCVVRPADERAAVRQDDGNWRFHWSQLTSFDDDSAYVLAIRLPSGAELLTAEPQADDIRKNLPTTTLVWRRLLAAGQGFGCDITYRLGDD
jgi:RNA polymerase sigma-70 factor, ECF subfamily